MLNHRVSVGCMIFDDNILETTPHQNANNMCYLEGDQVPDRLRTDNHATSMFKRLETCNICSQKVNMDYLIMIVGLFVSSDVMLFGWCLVVWIFDCVIVCTSTSSAAKPVCWSTICIGNLKLKYWCNWY